jgi:hypothetical protein
VDSLEDTITFEKYDDREIYDAEFIEPVEETYEVSTITDDVDNEESEYDEDYNEYLFEEELDLTEDGLTENDEFNNDEELVRDQAKHAKFSDSSDFFDEAPNKVYGIINNRDFDSAEDYDVIDEIEERVTAVENEVEDVDTGMPIDERLNKIGDGLKKFGSGVKNFGIHCGYFATNVYRMVKHKRAVARRKKEEQERRERARISAEKRKQQNRRAVENGGLVQVHSRTDRKPTAQNSSNRRPTSNGQVKRRRPTSSEQARRSAQAASKRRSNGSVQSKNSNQQPRNRR